MIEIRHDQDMFDQPADVRVNLVNCVGTMGAGVAYQFAKRYPEMLKEYRAVCAAGQLGPGSFWTYLSKDCIVFNMATKDHWRDPSRIYWVESGIMALGICLMQQSKETICTLPAPGCGFGGLDWPTVRDLCEKHLGTIEQKVILYYNPRK